MNNWDSINSQISNLINVISLLGIPKASPSRRDIDEIIFDLKEIREELKDIRFYESKKGEW